MNVQLSTLCYVKRNNQTLMLHRIKKDKDIHEGKYNGLGGKFLAHETPVECVLREVKEESGLTLHNPLLRGVLTFPLFDGTNDWHVFLFTAHDFEGDLIECDEGELKWIDDDKLCDLNLWEGDKHFFEWLKQDKFFTGRFVYKNKKLMEHSVEFH